MRLRGEPASPKTLLKVLVLALVPMLMSGTEEPTEGSLPGISTEDPRPFLEVEVGPILAIAYPGLGSLCLNLSFPPHP